MYSAVASVLLAAAVSGHEGDGHYVVEGGAAYVDGYDYAGHCLMPQNPYSPRYGCYPGNSRYLHRYPAFHGHSFRRPYNYRQVFDYPWHAELHEPTSLFAYEVEEQEVQQSPHAAAISSARSPVTGPGVGQFADDASARWTEASDWDEEVLTDDDSAFEVAETETRLVDDENVERPLRPTTVLQAGGERVRVWRFDSAGLDAEDLRTLLGESQGASADQNATPRPAELVAAADESTVQEAADLAPAAEVQDAQTDDEPAPVEEATVEQVERLAELLRQNAAPAGLTIRPRTRSTESKNSIQWRARGAD